MKQIPLTQGQVALVDDEDFEELNKYKWFAVRQRTGNFYASRCIVKRTNDSWNQKFIIMHRIISRTPDNLICDHKNGNGLDNRQKNLRNCNRSENNMNRKLTDRNSCGFKGVFFLKQTGKWRAAIGLHNKHFYIGSFSTKEDAAKAYDKKAKELFGEFAKLNF